MSVSREVAVTVNDIHKEFVLPQSKNSSFKQTFVNIVKKNNKVTQKVLDGVSFEVYKGDFFGIVGRNGSGKSTLLKLLAGVYVPTSGEISIKGKLTPFIELGVGFNPELSGRDNVYLNGALLGFDRKQMNTMYDDIVEFAELGPFMDQKLKNYSSGMQVRLAFSIAIKAKNDLLIFDEVLAVGDEAFQRKCLDVFEKYKAEGQTVILVTHDMETVRRYCNRAILINDGKLIKVGSPRAVADLYSDLNNQQIVSEMEHAKPSHKEHHVHLQIVDDNNRQLTSFIAGTEFGVSLAWKENHEVDSFVVNLFRKSGEHVTSFRVPVSGRNSFVLKTKPLLGKGKYTISIEAHDKNDAIISELRGETEFFVTDQDIEGVPAWSGMISVDHSVEYENKG